jgi:DNA-binding winged helix-turn-helix (wHTH) protein/TolB-like protein/Tfp pilus assembly protein PilF
VKYEKANQIRRFYEFGPFRLDPEDRTLWRDGQAVPLTLRAFDTLLLLVESGGQVVSKDELMEQVWQGAFVEENNLAQQVSFVRRALGESESGMKYIETIPKRGYRFVVTAREVVEERPSLLLSEQVRGHVVIEEEEITVHDHDKATALLVERAPAGALPEARTFTRQKNKWLIIGSAALLLVAGYLVYSYRNGKARGSNGPRTLAILPFRNLKNDHDTDFLSISLADAITTQLAYVNTVIVRPSSYVEKYRRSEIGPQQAAAELNVNTLLTGSFIKEGDDLRVSAQLIDVNTNEILWRDTIDLKYDKLLTLQDRVSRQVIDGLKLKLSPSEDQRLNLDAPHNALAYEYYLRGVDLYLKNEFPLAIEMLKKSVAIDSGYALAWAHLGTAYTANAAFRFGGREDYQRALEAYQKALALNPQQIEARIFMANLFTDTNRVAEAVPLLRDVLRTNSNYALAHWELGYAYRFTGMIDDSIAECERARAIDPEVKLHSSALNAYLYAGQYQKFLNSLPADESAAFVLFYRGLARLYLKDQKGSVADFDRAHQLDPSLYTEIGKSLSLWLAGDGQKGLELLRGTERRMDASGVSDAEAMYKISQAYALLGDKAASLRLLARSIGGGFFCYPYIKTDPLLENLRQESEYGALLEAARKSHEEFKSRFF